MRVTASPGRPAAMSTLLDMFGDDEDDMDSNTSLRWSPPPRTKVSGRPR